MGGKSRLAFNGCYALRPPRNRWRPLWSSQRNPEGTLPGLHLLEEYLQLRRQKSAGRIDGMHEDFRRRPIRKKPDEFSTRDLSIAIGRWQQADAVAPIGKSAHRLEISRRHRPRDVELDGFLAADQMPFRLVVTSVQDHALMLAQVLGPRWGKPTVQIFRRSDDIAHALSDALGDQARIRQLAKADSDIDIFGYQIQEQG